jgi:hypothetical protein
MEGGDMRPLPPLPGNGMKPALSGSAGDAPLTYKRVSFLLPTMRLLNSMLVSPELSDRTGLT